MYVIPACLNPAVERVAATTWCGVEFYYAMVGAGKSHHMMKARVLTALKEGRHVWTNIDMGGPLMQNGVEVLDEELKAALILGDYLKKDVRHLFHKIDSEWVRSVLTVGAEEEFRGIPSGSRVILDEVQNIFPTKKFNKDDGGDGFFRLLTKCRHWDIDFCFVTQSPGLVDTRLVNTSSKIIQIKNGGFMSRLAGNYYRLAFYQNLRDKKPFDTENCVFDKDIFKLYKSADVKIKHSGSLIPSFLYLPIGAVLFMAILVWWRVPRSPWLHGKYGSSASTSASVSKSPQMPIPAVLVSTPVPSGLMTSQEAINELLRLSQIPPVRDSVSEQGEDVFLPQHVVIHGNKPVDPNGYVMKHTLFN